MSGEFNLIYQHIAPQAGLRGDVVLGIGDDGAVIQAQQGQQVVVALDTLVAGRHFFVGQDAADIAYKSLAVNLSDLAAMGATPKWALLSLALPQDCAHETWISRFMAGWIALARQYDVALIGGDTTRSDTLTISVTLMGEVAAGRALKRAGARAGDDIWVSGTIGDAGLALQQLLAQSEPDVAMAQRLHRPTPRVALGQLLGGVATAAIDVSDGLLADLGHLLKASGVGASLRVDDMPFSAPVQSWVQQSGWQQPLSAGDDYELLFTAPAKSRAHIRDIMAATGVPVCTIGMITASSGLQLIEKGVAQLIPSRLGFDHFGATDYNETILTTRVGSTGNAPQ
jgi:thiamine-monophosphate kinase